MSCVCDSKFSNGKLRKGDMDLKAAVSGTYVYLKNELKKDKFFSKDWYLEISDKITLEEIKEYLELRRSYYNEEFDDIMDITYSDRVMEPDGGLIWLTNKKNPALRFPILVSEMKTQGTNEGRNAYGLKNQATGNAIERSGRYGLAFRNMYEYDDILPLVVFASGCDFNFDTKNRPVDSASKIQGGKIVSMNGGMAPFNKIYTSKNMPRRRRMLPNTFMARKEYYSVTEMMDVLKVVSLDALKYFKKVLK